MNRDEPFKAMIEYKHAEEELRESEELHRITLGNISDAVFITDDNGAFTFICPNVDVIFGYSFEEAQAFENISRLLGDGLFSHDELRNLGEIRNIEWEVTDKSRKAHHLLINVKHVSVKGGTVLYSCRDITERKWVEDANQLSHRFLSIANRFSQMEPLIEEFVAQIKKLTGCAAVGIRILDKDGNIPYQAHDGFEQWFYESESPLSIKHDQCMCINVITGKLDGSLPFCTEFGSFYMNGTTRFLATVSEQEKGQTRNVCNAEGYESVALVPIRMGGCILGLIHVADPREDAVPPKMVESLEVVTSHLASAIERVKAEEKTNNLAKFPSENPNPVFRIAGGGTLVYANEASGPFLNAGSCKVGGSAPDSIKQSVTDVLASGSTATIEIPHEERIFSFVAVPVTKEGYVNWYGRDVTEQKLAEDNLRNAKDELAAKVKERTADLAGTVKELTGEINRRELAEQALREGYQHQRVLNSLLELSLEELSLEDLLQKSLDQIISIPWLSIESTGAIFLIEEENNELVMEVQKGLCDKLKDQCSRVPLGTCLCGRAALSDKVVFSDCIDERHENEYKGMVPHGHYCVPITSTGGKTLGVMCFYLPEGHARDEKEEEFLLAISNVLAGIIERGRTLQRLQDSESSLSQAQEIAKLGNWDWNIVRNELRWSDEIYRIFGVSPQEFGATYEAFLNSVHPDDREMVRKAVDETLHNGKPYSIEHRIVHPDGTECIVHERGEVFFGESGKPVRMLGTVQDITERKEVEEERAAIEEQFRHSQKMEAVGRLTSGIAHDFRNQLTVIKCYGEMLERRLLVSDEAQGYVEQILEAVERSASLTAKLLAYSRKQPLRVEVVDVKALIGDLIASLKTMAGEHLHLSFIPSAELGSVEIDPGQFQQVLANLVVNARDAMPKGGEVLIETAHVELDDQFVDSHPGASSGPHVLVAVRDTGTGMDENTLRNIFEPFFTTKPIGEGTGLGLSMAYGFVKQSGGYIDVESKVGEGTTFRVYVPCAEEPAEVAEHQKVPAPEGLAPHTGTLLVVEDEEAVRRVTVDTLREFGHTVLECGNAAEALPLVQHYEDSIDMVITDVIMPGMSGADLAEHVQAARPNTKLLFMSGYMPEVFGKQYAGQKSVELLPKPFSSQSLVETVQRILSAA